jgi:hypothetical protein
MAAVAIVEKSTKSLKLLEKPTEGGLPLLAPGG